MAVSAGTAALQVVPTLTKTFSRDLATQLAGPATRTSQKAGQEHGRKFGTSFSTGIRTGVGPVRGILRGFGPGLAAAFGATALVAGIKDVTNEAREAAIVGKQTAAVLKSTGGAANVSAKQIEQLATALSNKSGVDDEAIQSAQNLLLTFTGIRNEAGKGNDIFNQSSSAILDMTAAMNKGNITSQGLKTSTLQVGKALNDPIRGMTALSRVGVTFNAQQREQIKTLVESGDKLGAQRIILAELRKEFGGSAAASADAGKRFGVFIGNLKEQIGTALLPILNRLLEFLLDKLPGALRAVGGFFRLVSTGVQALIAAFKEGDVTSDGFVGVMEKIGVALRAVWGVITRFVVPAFRSIADSVRPAVEAFVGALLPGLKSLWKVLVAQVWPALKIVAAVIGVVLFAALKYVLPLLLRLAGPVLGFLFKQLGQTIQWISNVIRWIGRVGAALLRWLAGTKTTGEAVKVFAQRAGKAFADIGKAVSSMWNGVIKPTFAFLVRTWLRVAGSIVHGAAIAFGWVPGVGPKLKVAAKAFDKFAANVNKSLETTEQAHVTKVTASFGWQGLQQFSVANSRVKMQARGGPTALGRVTLVGEEGPELVKFTSPGYVYPADETKRMLRSGMADGGPVGVSVRPGLPPIGQLNQRIDQYEGLVNSIQGTVIGAVKKAAKAFGGTLGGAGGPGGWRWQMAVLRQAFPGLPLISGFRPGAITATGNRSYHSMGRAVDIPPRMDVFNWIRGMFGKNTKELIFSPAGGRQVHNGQPHYYTGVTRGDHWDHVHWAYDKGGWLPPGRSVAVNNTGRPERVLGPDETLVPAGQGGITVNVTVNGAVGSPRDIAQVLVPEIRQGLKEAQRRSGVPAREQVR